MKRGLEFDIAICGAGMVGALLAALLRHEPPLATLRIALIDEHFTPQPNESDIDLRVSALSRASQRLLERVGAWALIPATQRCAYQEMVVWDAQGDVDGIDALRFSASALGEPDLGHIVTNQWLQWAALAAAQHVHTTRYAAALTDITLDANSARIELSDGRRFSAGLVLGADGARSRSRECVGIATTATPYPQSAVVTHLRSARVHQHTAWQRFLPSGPLALLPLADGRVSLVWSTTHDDAARLCALPEAEFAQELTQATDHVLGELTLTAPRARFALQAAQVSDYCRARFALLGDAAHSVHPLAGQGVNLGMMDAACLVQVLADASAQGASADALGELRVLRRYARWRKSENTLALQLMDGINRLFSNDSGALRALRRTGFAALQRLPLLKAQLMQRALGLAGELPSAVRRS